MVQVAAEDAPIDCRCRISQQRVRTNQASKSHPADAEPDPSQQLAPRESRDGPRARALTAAHVVFLTLHRSMTNSSKFMMALTTVVIAAYSAGGSVRSDGDSPMATSRCASDGVAV